MGDYLQFILVFVLLSLFLYPPTPVFIFLSKPCEDINCLQQRWLLCAVTIATTPSEMFSTH